MRVGEAKSRQDLHRVGRLPHEADALQQPLLVQQVRLVCGRRTTQLMRDPLGGKPLKRGFFCGTMICFQACGSARPPQGKLIEAIQVIDRGCQVYPADTLTLVAAHERYGPTCRPVLDPNVAPQYHLPRPARSYGRLALVIYGVGNRASSATMQPSNNGTTLQGQQISRQEPGVEFIFDSVPSGTYILLAKVGGHSHTVSQLNLRSGELWEFFFVPPDGR
jgi:hypothetical protein